MSVDQAALDALLSRATAIEARLEGAEDGPEVKELRDDLEGLRDEVLAMKSSVAEVEPEVVEPVTEPVVDPLAGVDPEVAALIAEHGPVGEAGDFTDLEELEALPMDYDPEVVAVAEVVDPEDGEKGLPGAEVKAWAKCSKCGSRDADEYADGTARCEDCGNPLMETTEAADDDADDDDEPSGMGKKSLLSGAELMRAQRVGLGH